MNVALVHAPEGGEEGWEQDPEVAPGLLPMTLASPQAVSPEVCTSWCLKGTGRGQAEPSAFKLKGSPVYPYMLAPLNPDLCWLPPPHCPHQLDHGSHTPYCCSPCACAQFCLPTAPAANFPAAS